MLNLNEIKKNLFNNVNFLIAYSGGLDSTVLLHNLSALSEKDKKMKLRAIHIHHGLSKKSDRWAQHCFVECKKLNIPLLIKHIKINKKNKKGIEATAREKRYKIFFSHLKKKEVLVTGHHINDQCETFLLSLKRGSGPLGLSGMSKISNFRKNIILKPFLNYTKNELIIWAKKKSLIWMQDESNENIQYERNFLRKKIVPVLVKRWPYIYKNILRASELCKETENLVDELIFPFLLKNMQKDGSLLTSCFEKYSILKKNALLRRWIQFNNGEMPSRYTLKRILNLCMEKKDNNTKIQINTHEIRKYRNQIYWVPIIPMSLKNSIFEWRFPWNPLVLPQNLGTISIYSHDTFHKIKKYIFIRKPFFYEKVTIRFQVKGKIKIFGINKKIKNIWQSFSIPPWNRNRIPLLFYNEILISAIGVFITQEGNPHGYLKKNKNWFINYT